MGIVEAVLERAGNIIDEVADMPHPLRNSLWGFAILISSLGVLAAGAWEFQGINYLADVSVEPTPEPTPFVAGKLLPVNEHYLQVSVDKPQTPS